MATPPSLPPSVAPAQAPVSLDLVRLAAKEDGCFGLLLLDGYPWLSTLERTYPLPGGAQGVKVPDGTYRCLPTFFQRGGYRTFQVCGVPEHTLIKIHVGNEETDSDGCILLGKRSGLLQGKWAVLDSAAAMLEFMGQMGRHACFDLRVRRLDGVDVRWV